jgi:ATP-dependent helicase HrpB
VERVEWDARQAAVVARQERRLGALLLETRLIDPGPEALRRAMLDGVRALGIEALPWTDAARALRARLRFAASLDQGAWPDVSDEALLNEAEQWLAPALDGMTRRDHLARLDLSALLRERVPRSAYRSLDRIAPTHYVVPSGSRIPINYEESPPALAVRLQELFGLHETPSVADGRVPLVVKLLSPASRPVQVTRDLPGFWARGYAEVRRELKGRYPKHYWPEDPYAATPTSRVRPRRAPS